MKKSKLRLLLCLFLSIFVFRSTYAGVLLDPYLGFSLVGGTRVLANNTLEESSDFSGTAFGIRGGYTLLGLMGGIDYGRSFSDWDQKERLADNSITEYSDEASRKMYGIFLGYSIPMMIRVWMTYYWRVKTTFKGAASDVKTNADGTETITRYNSKFNIGSYYKGHAFGVGLGVLGVPFLSLNFEYKLIRYSEYYNSSSGKLSGMPRSSADEDLVHQEMFFSISAPFDLF